MLLENLAIMLRSCKLFFSFFFFELQFFPTYIEIGWQPGVRGSHVEQLISFFFLPWVGYLWIPFNWTYAHRQEDRERDREESASRRNPIAWFHVVIKDLGFSGASVRIVLFYVKLNGPVSGGAWAELLF